MGHALIDALLVVLVGALHSARGRAPWLYPRTPAVGTQHTFLNEHAALPTQVRDRCTCTHPTHITQKFAVSQATLRMHSSRWVRV